jgi:hypothetical protein
VQHGQAAREAGATLAQRLDVALVLLALVLLIIGTLNADATITKAAGWVTFAFAALGVYLFLSAASVATDGKGYPLGPPLVR